VEERVEINMRSSPSKRSDEFVSEIKAVKTIDAEGGSRTPLPWTSFTRHYRRDLPIGSTAAKPITKKLFDPFLPVPN
jgi:hypothetical protein